MQIIQQSQEVLQAKQRLGIVGNAPALTAAIVRAIQVAPIDMSVLVIGESGAGKEFFPKIIHAFSPRKHNKYIAVNCGAIPEGTIDSELFGHEKGAFTSAISARKGYFEEANGGTIFLDEVAELPLTTQARLLRVLESGEYIKVGSSEVQKTNIRIVAATNVDMAKAVREGKFREDLYYRLSGVQIPVPALRERGSDVVLLARKFAADCADKYNLPAINFTESAKNALMSYRWPGNVRQLKNVIEQVAIFEAGTEVTEESIRQYMPIVSESFAPTVIGGDEAHSYANEREALFKMIFRLQHEIDELKQMIGATHPTSGIKAIAEHSESTDTSISSLVRLRHKDDDFTPAEQVEMPIDEPIENPTTLEDNERELIKRALERNDGRRGAAAKELKISERTLYRKIKEYGLE
ncbi:MAG: sigma-54 interaction domain-containing protein [Muribaculaceae bacterium]